MTEKSFTENGTFINAELFESIWVKDKVREERKPESILSDNEYIDYKIWEDMNYKSLYSKHLPGVVLFRGENPNIIYHGGCLGCLSQRLHGFERCKGCQYFRANWKLPNLKIEGEDSAKLSGDDIKDILK